MKPFRWEIAATALGLVLLAGCSVGRVQVWANSDTDDPNVYTQRNPHYVHMGEVVQFRAVVEPDTASYVLADVDGQRVVMPKVSPGTYAMIRRFDAKWRDLSCTITVQAYRQNGKPDFLVEAGVVRKLDLGADPPDDVIGAATMKIQCYQSKAVISCKWPDAREPDWSGVKLQIFGPGNKVSTIQRAREGVNGFTPLGRDAWGNYTVFYEPTFDQVRRTGKTRAVLIIPDPAGNKDRQFDAWFDTP